MSKCGTCTACCKLIGVKELQKPSNTWCTHCAPGSGCKIYEARPISCRDFECFWLQAGLDEGLRPDNLKVIFIPTTNDKVMGAMVDPSNRDAWSSPKAIQVINAMTKAGMQVIVSWGPGREKLLLTAGASDVVIKRTIVVSEPNENGMQTWGPE